jgi:outer membrane protein OmpA-like peptidoglycan-associated protein
MMKRPPMLAASQRRVGARFYQCEATDMLVAKRYGSAYPIDSNDTPEGRLRNRASSTAS